MKRRFSVFVVAFMCCVFLSSCSGGTAQGSETIVLNVYNWGQYISDGSEGSLDVNAAFEEYYYETFGQRVRVNYTTYASNEDMYNKIKDLGIEMDDAKNFLEKVASFFSDLGRKIADFFDNLFG